MLTDFTIENGCTRVVPMSHRSRRKSPPEGLEEAGMIQPVEGSAGSVVLWHSGLYHQGGPNTSKDAVRVGLNIACAPPSPPAHLLPAAWLSRPVCLRLYPAQFPMAQTRLHG